MSARRLSMVIKRRLRSRGGPTSWRAAAAGGDASRKPAADAETDAEGAVPAVASGCALEQASSSKRAPAIARVRPSRSTGRIYDDRGDLAHEIVTARLRRACPGHSGLRAAPRAIPWAAA